MTPPMKRMSNGVVYCGPEQLTERDLLDKFDIPRSTGIMSVDTETLSLENKTCVGIGFAISSYEAFYVPVLPSTCAYLPRLMATLANPRITKIYHNSNFDLAVMRKLAIDEWLPMPDTTVVEDTSIMAQVSANRVALETLGKELLGHTDLFSVQDVLELC